MKLVNLFSTGDLPNFFKAKSKMKGNGNSSNMFLGVKGGWWGGHNHTDDENDSTSGDGDASGGDGGGE